MTRNPVYRFGYGLMWVAFRLHLRWLYIAGGTICNWRLARGDAP